MNKELLMNIVFGVREYDSYFICKKDCTGFCGFPSVHKCTAVMCCLAYGAPPDADYLQMAKPTCFETVYRFCRAVIALFGLFEGTK
jgi:hypothetical protein